MLRIRFFLTIFFLFALVSTTKSFADEYAFDKHFSQGMLFLKKQNVVLAIPKLQKSQKIALDHGYVAKELNVLIKLLEIYLMQSDAQNIISTISQLESLSVKLTHSMDLVRCYRILGLASQAMLKPELARDYFSVAAEFARTLDDSHLLANLLNEVGLADAKAEDFDAAMMSFKESFHLAEALNDYRLMLASKVNQIQNMLLHNKTDGLHNAFDQVEKISKKIPASDLDINYFTRVGLTYWESYKLLGKKTTYLKQAFKHFSKAKSIAEKSNATSSLSYVLTHLALLYMADGNFDTAIQLTKKAINLAKNIKNHHILFEGYSQLGKIYLVIKDYQKAYTNFNYAIQQLDEVHLSSLLTEKGAYQNKIGSLFESSIKLLIEKKVTLNTELANEQLVNLILLQRRSELESYCFATCKIEKQSIGQWHVPEGQALVIPYMLSNQLILASKIGNTLHVNTQAVDEETLTKELASWNKTTKKTQFDKYAEEFHQLLFVPIESMLKGKNVNDLVFLPSRNLLQLPYASLRSNNRYLIESFQISVSSLKKYKKSELAANKFIHNISELTSVEFDKNNSILVLEDTVRLFSDFRKSSVDGYSEYSLARVFGLRSDEPIQLAVFKQVSNTSYAYYYNFAILGIQQTVINTSPDEQDISKFTDYMEKNLDKTKNIKHIYQNYLKQHIKNNSNNPAIWSKLILLS